MKIHLLLPTIVVATLITTPAFAERNETQQALLEGGTFTSLAIAGTVAGGPVGMVVGAIAGAFLAQETRDANDNEIALNTQKLATNELEENLMRTEQQIAKLQQDLVQKLTFQVLFATGEDTLNELDQQRVEKLAQYLLDNPSLKVNLDGHADNRGTDEYNNVLSIERAKSVKSALIEQGVGESRITHSGHGSIFATAEKGDESALAKDRKVMIQLLPMELETEVSSVTQF